MKRLHRITVIVALFVSVLRLVGRTTYVIVAGAPEGIPLICLALLSIACLMYLLTKGGCCTVFLYALIEPVLSTTMWIVILYTIDTNDFCREMGDSVCEIPVGNVPKDHITRPYYTWLILLIPGFIFDIIIIIIFTEWPQSQKA